MTTDNGTAVVAATASSADNNEGDNVASELESKIIRQIEYYFGDHNLQRDKFLKEETTKNDGWFPLETLVRFNRLKCLSSDFDVIKNALKKSQSGLLEVHEDGTQIRRAKSKPLPVYDDRRQEDVDARSIYVKGFPTEMTIDELLAYFKQHGNVEHVQMRYRYHDKNKKETAQERQNRFKGSVFIVYPTKEEAIEFQKKEEVKYNDTVLLCEMRQDYFDRKHKERAEQRQQKKKQRIENNKSIMGEDSSEDKSPDFEKGCVLHLSDIGEDTRHEDIKAFFQKHADVAYVDHRIGLTEANIRFKESKAQEAMDKAKEANDGKLNIKDTDVTARVLEGEEEVEYWKKSLKDRQISKQGKSRGGGRGGRGRGGGRGGRSGGKYNRNREGYNKRQADKNNDEPANKRGKKEESEPAKAEAAASE